MKQLLAFVQGKLTFDEFELYQLINPEIWDEIQALVTDEIISDSTKCFSESNRHRLISENYSVKSVVLAFGFSYGKYIAHSIISDLIEYYYPGVQRKNPPEISFQTILEKLNMDYLGGDGVEDLISDILSNPIGENAKERNASYKIRLKDAFHLEGKKRPHWAQEAEWPMGESCPMKFLKEQLEGDKVKFVFKDTVTDELKEIVQFY